MWAYKPFQVVVFQPHVGIFGVPFRHDIIPQFSGFLHVLAVAGLVAKQGKCNFLILAYESKLLSSLSVNDRKTLHVYNVNLIKKSLSIYQPFTYTTAFQEMLLWFNEALRWWVCGAKLWKIFKNRKIKIKKPAGQNLLPKCIYLMSSAFDSSRHGHCLPLSLPKSA